MKRYFLGIDEKSNIEIFILDDSKANFEKKLEKRKKRYSTVQEITVDSETLHILNNLKKKKIDKKDIEFFLQNIANKLAVNDLPDNIKRTFLKTYKENKKINPIFILFFKSNLSVVDILKKLDFPNKWIIIEILTSDKTNKEKYDYFKRVQEIYYMKKELEKKVWGVAKFSGFMFMGISLLAIGFKFLLAPKMIEFTWKLLETMWKSSSGGWTLLIELASNYFFYFIIWVISLIILLLLIKIFSKKLFLQIVLNTPKIWDIIRKQNSINILMLYSFYYNNSNKFFEKFKEHFNMLPMPISWIDIPDLISKTYSISKEEFRQPIYEIEVVDIIDTLSSTSTPDEMIKKHIQLYMNNLSEDIDVIAWTIKKASILVIWLLIWIMFYSLVWSMKGMIKTIQSAKI